MLLVTPSFPSITVKESLISTNLVFKEYTPLYYSFLSPTTFLSSDPLYSSLWGLWKFPNHKVCFPSSLCCELHLFAVNYLPPNQLYWSNFYSRFKMYVSWHSILNKVSSSFKHFVLFCFYHKALIFPLYLSLFGIQFLSHLPKF